MSEFAELMKVYGPTLVITAVFVWQAVRREVRMSQRIDHLEDKLTTILIDTVNETPTPFMRLRTRSRKK